MLSIFIQFLKAVSPIFSTLLGMFIIFNDVQSENVSFSINLILFGNVIFSKDWHLENAPSPILVIVLGKLILTNDVHPLNK